MKRISVYKMLKHRLAESLNSLRISKEYESVANVLGGDISKENQLRINLNKDILELNFLLEQYRLEFKIS